MRHKFGYKKLNRTSEHRKAMLKMITDPSYLESEKHRSAGLEGQLNIETKEF